jgi:hypothetical protein
MSDCNILEYIYLYIYLSICLSIYLFIYLSTLKQRKSRLRSRGVESFTQLLQPVVMKLGALEGHEPIWQLPVSEAGQISRSLVRPKNRALFQASHNCWNMVGTCDGSLKMEGRSNINRNNRETMGNIWWIPSRITPGPTAPLRMGGGFNRAGGFVELLNFDEPKKVTLRRGWVEITWAGSQELPSGKLT